MIIAISCLAVVFAAWLFFYGLDMIRQKMCKHKNLSEKFTLDGFVCDDCGKRFDTHPGGEGGQDSKSKSLDS